MKKEELLQYLDQMRSFGKDNCENMESKNRKGFPCPVCGEYIFRKESDFDICSVCGWQNEPTSHPDEVYSGANTMSLNEARARWAKDHKHLYHKAEQ